MLFTVDKEGRKTNNTSTWLCCVVHILPFNTNFPKLISSHLLPQQNIWRKASICYCGADHTQLLKKVEWWSHNCQAVVIHCSSRQSLQRGWCNWKQANLERRKDPMHVCKWEGRSTLFGEIPSGIQLLLALLLLHIPTSRTWAWNWSLEIWMLCLKRITPREHFFSIEEHTFVMVRKQSLYFPLGSFIKIQNSYTKLYRGLQLSLDASLPGLCLCVPLFHGEMIFSSP